MLFSWGSGGIFYSIGYTFCGTFCIDFVTDGYIRLITTLGTFEKIGEDVFFIFGDVMRINLEFGMTSLGALMCGIAGVLALRE